MPTRSERIAKAASLPVGHPERKAILASAQESDEIAEGILKKLRGRWDSMPDFDDPDFIFSFGRDTDPNPNPMSPGELMQAVDTITDGVAKHGLRVTGGVRLFAQGDKILIHINGRR